MRSHKPLLQSAPLPPTLLLPPSDTITIQRPSTLNKNEVNDSPSKNDNITSTSTNNNNEKQSKSKDDDDDFDIDAYYARLHAIPSGLTPTDVTKKSIVEESTFSEIDLNSTGGNQFDADDGVVQSHGLTSELAQNLSQLPQVLPQVANTVLNSFSNILNMGRGVIRQEYFDQKPIVKENVLRPTESVDQYPVYETAVDENLPPVPLFNTNEFSSIPKDNNLGSYSLQHDNININSYVHNIESNNAKENDPPNSGAGNVFRLNSKKKKIYAPVPGLTLGEYNTNSIPLERELPSFPPINKNNSPHIPPLPITNLGMESSFINQPNNSHTTQNNMNIAPLVTQSNVSNVSFYDPTNFIQNSSTNVDQITNNLSYIQPPPSNIVKDNVAYESIGTYGIPNQTFTPSINSDKSTEGFYKNESILQPQQTYVNNLPSVISPENLQNSFINIATSLPTQVINNNHSSHHSSHQTSMNNRLYHIPTSSITTPILSIRESTNIDDSLQIKSEISPTTSRTNLFPSSVKTKLKAKHTRQYPYKNNHSVSHNVTKKSRNSKIPLLGVKDLHNYLGVNSFSSVSKDIKNVVKLNDAIPSTSTSKVNVQDDNPLILHPVVKSENNVSIPDDVKNASNFFNNESVNNISPNPSVNNVFYNPADFACNLNSITQPLNENINYKQTADNSQTSTTVINDVQLFNPAVDNNINITTALPNNDILISTPVPSLIQPSPSNNTSSPNVNDSIANLDKEVMPVFFNPTAFSNPDPITQSSTLPVIPLENINPPITSENKFRLSSNRRPKYYSGPIDTSTNLPPLPNIQPNLQTAVVDQNISQENVVQYPADKPVKNFGLDVIQNTMKFTKLQSAVTSFFNPNQVSKDNDARVIDSSIQSTYEPSPSLDWNPMQMNQSAFYNPPLETIHPYDIPNNANIPSEPLFVSSFGPSADNNLETYSSNEQIKSEPQFPMFFTVPNVQNDNLKQFDLIASSEKSDNSNYANSNPQKTFDNFISQPENQFDTIGINPNESEYKNTSIGNIIISNPHVPNDGDSNANEASKINQIHLEDYVIEPSTDENPDDDLNTETNEVHSSLILDSFRFASNNLIDQIESINRPLLKDDPTILSDICNSNDPTYQFDLLNQTEFLDDQPRVSAFMPVVPNIKCKENQERNNEEMSNNNYFYNSSNNSNLVQDDSLSRFITNVTEVYESKNDTNILSSFFDTKNDESFMMNLSSNIFPNLGANSNDNNIEYKIRDDSVETETKTSDDNNVSEDDSLRADNEIRDILSHVNNEHNYDAINNLVSNQEFNEKVDFPDYNDIYDTEQIILSDSLSAHSEKTITNDFNENNNIDNSYAESYNIQTTSIDNISLDTVYDDFTQNISESNILDSSSILSNTVLDTFAGSLNEEDNKNSITEIDTSDDKFDQYSAHDVFNKMDQLIINPILDSLLSSNESTEPIPIKAIKVDSIEKYNESISFTSATANYDFFNSTTSTANFFDVPSTINNTIDANRSKQSPVLLENPITKIDASDDKFDQYSTHDVFNKMEQLNINPVVDLILSSNKSTEPIPIKVNEVDSIEKYNESVSFAPATANYDFFNSTTSMANFFDIPSTINKTIDANRSKQSPVLLENNSKEAIVDETDNKETVNNENSVPLFTFFSSIPSNSTSFNL